MISNDLISLFISILFIGRLEGELWKALRIEEPYNIAQTFTSLTSRICDLVIQNRVLTWFSVVYIAYVD